MTKNVSLFAKDDTIIKLYLS